MKQDTEKGHLAWNMTRNCNFRCDYCYFPHDNRPVTDPLPVERVLDFLGRTGREWVVGLTGGEPLIYPDIVHICRRLTENHRIEIDSNLSLSGRVRDLAETLDPSRVLDVYAALHIVERERRGGVAAFVENVRLLLSKGFHVTVNYVIHPTLAERFPRDRDEFAAQGVKLVPRPFKGVYRGVVYPAGYDAGTRALFADRPTAAKKMVYNFKGVPCDAGRRLLRLDPDGAVRRCAGDLTVLGNVLGEVTLFEGSPPCRVGRCPCFGTDYVRLTRTQEFLLTGITRLARDKPGPAREAFAEAVALDADYSPAINNLGVALWRLGDEEGALARFAQAHRLHPLNKVYTLNLASRLLAARRDEEAARVCSEYLADRDDPDVRRLAAGEGGPAVLICVDFVSADTREDIFPVPSSDPLPEKA